MTPLRRLAIGGLGIVTGGALGIAGGKMSWRILYLSVQSSVPVSGLGDVRIPQHPGSRSGFDVAPGAAGCALLVVIGGILVFLVGPRARTVATIACAALALVGGVLGLTATAVHPSTGRALFEAGMALALGASALTLSVARAVPRIGMPESGPSEAVT